MRISPRCIKIKSVEESKIDASRKIISLNRVIMLTATVIMLAGCLDSSSDNKSGSSGGTERITTGTTMTINGTRIACQQVAAKVENANGVTLAPGTEHTVGGTTYQCYNPNPSNNSSGSWTTVAEGTTNLKFGEQVYLGTLPVRCREQSGTSLTGAVAYVGPGGNFNGITCSQ